MSTFPYKFYSLPKGRYSYEIRNNNIHTDGCAGFLLRLRGRGRLAGSHKRLYRQPEHASAVFIRLWYCHGRTVPDSRHARHHDFTFSDKEKGNLCPVYYLLRPCDAGSQCRRNHLGNLSGKGLPLLLVGLHGNPSSHYPVHLRSDKPRLCLNHYHLYG